MASYDPAALAALKALPASHRRYLIGRFEKYPKGITTDEGRLEVLAARLSAEELRYYSGLYYPRGGVVDWRIDRDVRISTQAIEAELRRKYPNAITGLRPALVQGQPPKLHKIFPRAGRLGMSYVEWAKPRSSSLGYETVVTQPPNYFRVNLRDEPFTIEMRHVPRARQPLLAAIIGADIGQLFLHNALLNTTLCRVDTRPLQAKLEKRLDAIETDVFWVGNGNDHLQHCAVGSDETISVRKQKDFLDQAKRFPMREESKRTWVFWTRHTDGYVEKAYYTVKLLRGSFIGEMTVSDEISDTAIENLRSNVVALF
jgi:hypothetical protein